MINYELYCKIVQLHQNRLRVSQIAHLLGLDERTVAYWIEERRLYLNLLGFPVQTQSGSFSPAFATR